MSFIFQSFNLFPGLTATENVEFGVDVAGKRGSVDPKEALESVGLGHRFDHFPHELSGGEQQRRPGRSRRTAESPECRVAPGCSICTRGAEQIAWRLSSAATASRGPDHDTEEMRFIEDQH